MTAANEPVARKDVAAATGYFKSVARLGPAEIAFWVATAAFYFVPDANLILAGQIVIWGLFAMSLDLLLGYRGIPSIGHAVFFGVGAYTAGFLGKFGWTEPISALLVAMLPVLAEFKGTVVRDTLQVFPASGALCQVADLVNGGRAETLRLTLADGRTCLVAGDAIRVFVLRKMPAR